MEPPTSAERTAIANGFLDDEAAKVPEEYELYFKYYETVLNKLPGHVRDVPKPAYSSHGEVISFFNTLIGNVSQTKADFNSLFAPDVEAFARDHATRLLLQASLKIDCDPWQASSCHKLGDYVPRTWEENQSFVNFVECCFPSTPQSQQIREESKSALAQRHRLAAWELEQYHEIRLRPTDDLAKHLAFNPDNRVLYVFREFEFLKMHLYRSREEAIDSSFKDSLAKGTLPPQLLLEILDSIQYFLFPFDVRSSKLPGRRINTYDFDPEATFYTFYSGPIRRVPDDFEYKYLGARVATLMRVVDKASPQSAPPQSGIGIIPWFERHASERNILTVVLLCLFLTVFAGFLSFILSIVQLFYSIKSYNLGV